MFIATRMVEILPEVRDIVRPNITSPCVDRANTPPQALEAICRHEAMLAELLRATDARVEDSPTASPKRSDETEIRTLAVDLVSHC